MTSSRPVPRRWLVVALMSAAFAAGPAVANGSTPTDGQAEALQSQFEKYHPDLTFRRMGLEAYERGNHENALRLLRNAAYYGDKASQAWSGRCCERAKAMTPIPRSATPG